MAMRRWKDREAWAAVAERLLAVDPAKAAELFSSLEHYVGSAERQQRALDRLARLATKPPT